MIKSKEEYYSILERLRELNFNHKLSKNLQAKLEAFEEMEELVNLTTPVVMGSFKIQVQTESNSFYVCVLANGQEEAEAKVKREYPDAKYVNSISVISGNPIF